jgi:hypothetical protein
VFKPDPKGCIRDGDLKLKIPLYHNIPPMKTWDDSWTMGGIDTEIRIERIIGLDWDTRKGTLIIYCRCSYYINEFHEDYKKPQKKPVLKLV